ncbi:MAG: radical SAM protein [Planctomycetes bacterium]|nr:radical SAM protein [Planctomycetota bacterium]
MDPSLILKAAMAGQEISPIEALLLLQADRSLLPEIFRVADFVNHRLHGDVVTYVHSAHLSYTNVCRSSSRTCSFYRKRGSSEAYVRSVEELLERVAGYADVTEVHYEGGLNPDLPYEYLRDILRETRRRFPSLQLRAFSPVEVHYYARKQRMSYRELLTQWKEDGLDFLPGTSAEILNDKLRKKICPDKLRTGEWVEIMRIAHQLGLHTSATILFGHIENEVHVVEHLDILRNLQKETGGFQEFLPIPFVPAHAAVERQELRSQRADIDEIFRLFALSRLFFSHSIQNLQAPWPHLGLEPAARSLSIGVNDLGGTCHEDDIVHDPSVTNLCVTPTALNRLLRKAGRTARQRDTFHKEIGAPPPRRAALANR